MINIKLKFKQLFALSLCLLLTGCTITNTIYETTMQEAKIVTFHTDLLTYEFSFINKDNKFVSSKEFGLNSEIEINNKLKDDEIKIYYELKRAYQIKSEKGKTIEKKLIDEISIDSNTRIILKMNERSFKNSKQEVDFNEKRQ